MAAKPFDQRPAASLCRKVGQPDRQTAEAVRIGLDLWHKATAQGRDHARFVVYRCGKCLGLHVGRRRVDARKARSAAEPARRRALVTPPEKSSQPSGSLADIRFLIEEFDLG